MRILFTFTGGQGHFEPLAPIARAAMDAGHTVAFGCGEALLAMVEAAGFAVLPIGPLTGSTKPLPERLPLLPVDRHREERDLRERFVRVAARIRVPHTRALCEQWRPDILVCDETDFGSLIAAECLGLPYATVLVIAAGAFVRMDVVGEALNELRAEHGLPADDELARGCRYLALSPCPRSYRDPSDPLPNTAHSIRPAMLGEKAAPEPKWSTVRPGAPTVYFTLGTIFNMESGDLLARVIDGLQELPINLVVTLGHQIDPAEFAPRPDHVHIARQILQSSLLPHCDLVVCHAGSGSVIGALAHGLPLLLIPIGADQPRNAKRCVELGVGQILDASQATPASVRAAAASLIEDARYRRNALRIKHEIAALPDSAHAVGLLEELAREKRPLLAE